MSLNKIAKWLIGRFYFYILALLEKTFFVVYEDTLVTFGAKIQIFCILGTLSTYILENSHFLVYQIYFCFSNLVTLISLPPYVGRTLLVGRSDLPPISRKKYSTYFTCPIHCYFFREIDKIYNI